MKCKLLTVMALLASSALSPAFAGEVDNLGDAIAGGDVDLDFRYRLELVDQTGIAKNATASTMRTRLGYTTQSYKGLSGFVQFENVTSLGAQNYNSTTNGNTLYPVVVDPTSTELNQAYLKFDVGNGLAIKGGREGINLGNQRFIGTVGWRQNDQTYDNVNISYSNPQGFTVFLAHVWQINRIFSHNSTQGQLDTNTHLIHASYDIKKMGKISAYGYLVDMDSPAFYGFSRNTYGARIEGSPEVSKGIKFNYELEYAKQSEAGMNPATFSADYYHIAGGIAANGFSATAGIESLGADNGVSFATPLATLHKFNGWADKFLGTPATGLKDVYVKLGWKTPESMGGLAGISVMAFYHDFSSTVGNVDYGSEIDWQIAKPFMKRYSLTIKGAHYNANSFATDTNKIWFMLTAKF